MDDMRLLDKKIAYFLRVVEAGSFSAAARKLYLTQSALSQQMTLLERNLDVQLFDRTGYRPVLTEKGKRFYEGCRGLQQSSRALLEDVCGHPQQQLNIGITGTYLIGSRTSTEK